MKEEMVERIKKRGAAEKLTSEARHRLWDAKIAVKNSSKHSFKDFKVCVTAARQALDDAEALLDHANKL